MTEDAKPKPKLVTPLDALDLSDLWLDPGLGDGITETVRHSIPLTLSAAVTISPKIPGSEPVVGKYARNDG